MGFDLASVREIRRPREVAGLQWQLDDAMRTIVMVYPQDILWNVQEALESAAELAEQHFNAKDSTVSASTCATPLSAVASTPSRMCLASPSFRAVSKSQPVLLTQRPLRAATTAHRPSRNTPYVP